MIKSFADKHTQELYVTGKSKRLPSDILKRAVRQIKPTHPGEMLREDFMPDYGLTAAGLAEKLGVSRQTVNEILRERRAVTPSMALRLSHLFGNTTEFWLNAQRAVDIYLAQKEHKKALARIHPLNAA